MLAAVGAGIHASLEEAAKVLGGEVTRLEPGMTASDREQRLTGWRDAMVRV
jgi:glycerol kinase